MKPQSAKAKGRLGQQEVRDKILLAFPSLEPDDVLSTSMGDTGEDIKLSPKARKLLPISLEVKRKKSGLTTIYNYYQQASNHKKGEPVVAVRQDRKEWLAIVSLDYLLELLK